MRQPFSTDYWHARVVARSDENDELDLERDMHVALKKEIPSMCSVTFERACNLQCRHCIYPYERSSEQASRQANLPELVHRAVEQLPGDEPRLLHEGRILRPWHVDVLAEAARRRPSLRIGLLDNGTYLRSIERFVRHGLKLDWVDISIDGPESVHNLQRGNAHAFRDALQGLRQAREIVASNGRVTSLFTLTELNYGSLLETADFLFGHGLIDQLHVTTLSPARAELIDLERFDLREFWSQARHAFRKYEHNARGDQRMFFRLYRHQELLKLAHVIGHREVARAFEQGVEFAPGEVYLTLQDVPIVFAPLSLWPGETFLIDADGTYRTAYSISRTLAELRLGRTKDGEDTRGFSVETLSGDFDLPSLYRRCVDQWWKFRGRRYLKEEAEVLRRLRTQA